MGNNQNNRGNKGLITALITLAAACITLLTAFVEFGDKLPTFNVLSGIVFEATADATKLAQQGMPVEALDTPAPADTPTPENASDMPEPTDRPATEVAADPPTATANPRPALLYFSEETIHLGDEDDVQGWRLLYGKCLDMDFVNDFAIESLTLKLQTFGAEAQNSVSLNEQKSTILPPQDPTILDSNGRPNVWTGDVVIPVPMNALVEGLNTLSLCAELNPNPDFSADFDDFQIRNIELVAN